MSPEKSQTKRSTLLAFWQTVTRVEKNKVNSWIAVRNSLAVAIPLAIGIAWYQPLGAVAVATGALNVAYSDGYDPYAQRARRMLTWTALGAVAVFVGSVTGSISWLAVLVAALWAFGAGLCASVSTRAGDLGLNTLVTCIVYGARGALSPKGALYAGLLVLAGGLLQMLFALIFWPLRRHSPERQAIGQVYAELAKELASTSSQLMDWLPLTMPSAQVQDTLAALGRDGSVEGDRFRMLFDQADRVRLSTFRLQRIHSEASEKGKEFSSMMLDLCPRILAEVARWLISDETPPDETELMAQLHVLLTQVNEGTAKHSPRADVSAAIATLAGQLRVVSQLAANSTTSDTTEFLKSQNSYSWRLQLGGWLGTLRANLDARSTFFRHAVRLATCVAVGDGIGRIFSWQRTYWIPMTIAVVLKPDFVTTFSRGVLRLGGTFAGLILATLLYHIFPPAALTQLVLVGLFTLSLRSVGPANYGMFSVSVSGLIVFLIAATGVSPKEVVAERAVNTAIGGAFALVAYALWPTWERTNVSESVARLIDATRAYFQAIVKAFEAGGLETDSSLDEYRAAWRRARSDAETSINRLSTEPGTRMEQYADLTSILASSRALILTLMSLEAGLFHFETREIPPEFLRFSHDVDFTLYFLVSALRGSHPAFETLPQLRHDHTELLKAKSVFASSDQFAIVETDRLTVALNTLREQVQRYLGGQPGLTKLPATTYPA